MITIINMMRISHTKTSMLGIPMTITYAILPIGMVLMIIRCVQECKKLYNEEEKVLGTSKPQIDLEAIERERDAKICEEGGAK
jgi:TRAP-type C4-dicarboxylate transport system permease small subunit